MSSQSSVRASTGANLYGETGAGARYRARISDVVRRRLAAGLLIAGIALAALAITDTGPFEDPPTQQARAEARYKFADAGAEPRTVLLLSEDGEWRVSDPG